MNIAWRLEPGTDLWIWRRMKRACKMNWSFGRRERIDLITAGFTWYMTFFIKGECWTKSQKALFRYFIHIRQAQCETLRSESFQSRKCKIFYFTDMTFLVNGECAKSWKLYSFKVGIPVSYVEIEDITWKWDKGKRAFSKADGVRLRRTNERQPRSPTEGQLEFVKQTERAKWSAMEWSERSARAAASWAKVKAQRGSWL